MQINWKYLAITPGYKSLKAAYIKDAKDKRSLRSKKELYKHFQWVINRAKHTAYATGTTIDVVLNAWEEKRDFWWLNYYQDSYQPKKHSASLMPMGFRGQRKQLKLWHRDPQTVKHIMRKRIKETQQKNSTKTKQRWTTLKKKHHHRYMNL